MAATKQQAFICILFIVCLNKHQVKEKLKWLSSAGY